MVLFIILCLFVLSLMEYLKNMIGCTDIFRIMKSDKSLSLKSNSFLSGQRLEESVLNQYRRVCFGQESFCFEPEPLQYIPLPEGLPSFFNTHYTHCIWLNNNHFYEVFTIAIFQYLLRDSSPKKVAKIQKIKNLICNDNFLPFASYMKGLILKGLKLMLENSSTLNIPVAHCLLESDKLTAFTQVWKELIAESSRFVKAEKESSNKSMISMLATFFDVDIQMYSLKGAQYELEMIESVKKNKDKQAVIPLLLVSSWGYGQGEHTGKEDSFSSISSIHGYSSYYILVNYPSLGQNLSENTFSKKSKGKKIQKKPTLLGQYFELLTGDEEPKKSVKTVLQNNPKKHKHDFLLKGQQLIADMKTFMIEMEGTSDNS